MKLRFVVGGECGGLTALIRHREGHPDRLADLVGGEVGRQGRNEARQGEEGLAFERLQRRAARRDMASILRDRDGGSLAIPGHVGG